MALGLDTFRPPIMGQTHMVSSGQYLAASAGYRILEQGGNAIDAGVASGIVINVTLPENTNFGGVAPIILYLAESDEVITISGLGRWPRAANIDHFVNEHGGEIPFGPCRSLVPSAPDAWMTAIERYGTMTFEQVVTPALELAEGGFPLPARVQRAFIREAENQEGPMWMFDSNREIFMPGGRVPAVGERFIQKDLAHSFLRLIEVEKANSAKGRAAAIRAARDFFYKGEIAEEIARFMRDQGGLLTLDDMREFSVGIEPAVSGQFKEYTVYTCGPWCQGPVVAQALQILQDDDLAAMGHNSADYVHLVVGALNLAFSDREYYYSDPDFQDVPMNGMMSPEYTRGRRETIDMSRAWQEMPIPGDPWAFEGRNGKAPTSQPMLERGVQADLDTSYTCVVDRWGNAFSATPSDVSFWTPIVPGLGFVVSGRGSQSWLDPDHPASLQPWKRPRLTPNPAIAFKDDKLFMPFGCPGGDAQCQAMVQTFLNVTEFGMNTQAAIEAPRFKSQNFPNSFWPHRYLPGRLTVEGRIPSEIRSDLEGRGHDVEVIDDWGGMAMAGMAAIVVDQESGSLTGGADPRRDTYAIGR